MVSRFLIAATYLYFVGFADGQLQVLSKGQIWRVEIGMSVEELSELDPHMKQRQEMREGEYFDEYVISARDLGDVTALMDENGARVYEISTRSQQFQTKLGARVGMTLAELKAVYPNGYLIHGWDAPVSLYGFALPEGEGSFVFDASRMLNQCHKDRSRCSNIEELLDNETSLEFFTH